MEEQTIEQSSGEHFIVSGHPAERGTFEYFLAAMDRADLADDPRFVTVADRIEHYDELRQILLDFARAVPDAATFAQRLLKMSDLVVVSVPYKWPILPKVTKGHVHDPVDYEKLTDWMGRKANYKQVVQEPFSHTKSQRLIAVYARDHDLKFSHKLAEKMIRR